MKGFSKALKQNVTFEQILQGLFVTEIWEGKTFQSRRESVLYSLVQQLFWGRHFFKVLRVFILLQVY